jgi:alanyl-tRNA synthetase
MVGSRLEDIINSAEEVEGIKVVAACLEDADMDGLRNTADRLRDRVPSSVVALASRQNGKLNVIVAMSKSLTSRLNASNIIKELSKITGGRGGGRPDMAQAGGGDPGKIDSALKKTAQIVRESLKD